MKIRVYEPVTDHEIDYDDYYIIVTKEGEIKAIIYKEGAYIYGKIVYRTNSGTPLNEHGIEQEFSNNCE